MKFLFFYLLIGLSIVELSIQQECKFNYWEDKIIGCDKNTCMNELKKCNRIANSDKSKCINEGNIVMTADIEVGKFKINQLIDYCCPFTLEDMKNEYLDCITDFEGKNFNGMSILEEEDEESDGNFYTKCKCNIFSLAKW